MLMVHYGTFYGPISKQRPSSSYTEKQFAGAKVGFGLVPWLVPLFGPDYLLM